MRRRYALLQVHVAVVLFGIAGLFGKVLAFEPVVIVFGRVVLAALALALTAAAWKTSLRLQGRRAWLAFAGLGALLAVHWVTFFASVQVSSVALALITYSTFPVFVVLLEPILFRERLHAPDIVLTLITTAGVAILAPSPELGDRTTQGVLWGVFSGLTFALLSLGNRRFVRSYSSITIAFYQDAVAAVVLLPFAAAVWPEWTWRDAVWMLALGVVCTALSHSLFIAGLAGVRARTASMIACLEPVYGALLAALLLDEVPSPRTCVGGTLVLAVALYATARAARDVPVPEPA
jgi:drug/metabolite transporter (DMT)-like permease